nr:MAG TPA: hypothetical protein [Caudoviricetes sp.]
MVKRTNEVSRTSCKKRPFIGLFLLHIAKSPCRSRGFFAFVF